MGATFSRVKSWVAEIFNASDINAEFDNILTNLTPAGVDDYSATVAQMKLSTSPGALATESLATSTAGEIERLRYALARIIGPNKYWYEAGATSLAEVSALLGTAALASRVSSGRTISADDGALAGFLVPDGGAKTVRAMGSSTNLVYYVAGVAYTMTTNVALTGLSAAPSSNNTCLVNDSLADGSEWTKQLGEYGTSIAVDTMGSSITPLVGTFAAFKTGTEYFTAYVESTTKLSHCRRGIFFDSADATFPRVALTDNDTITLMKIAWIFAKTDGTLTVTYNMPTMGGDAPQTSASGDYYLSYPASGIWYISNGATFTQSTATYIGFCICNTTACIGARSLDFAANYSAVGDKMQVELVGTSRVQARNIGEPVSVYGQLLQVPTSQLYWANSLATVFSDDGGAQQASTLYYLYIRKDAVARLSRQCPENRQDLQGLYHPTHSWRAFGQVYSNASSQFENVISYHDLGPQNYAVSTAVAAGALTTILHAPPHARQNIKYKGAASADMQMTSVLPMTKLVVSSTSTLGTVNATQTYLFLALIQNSDRLELAISQYKAGSNELVTTVAEGGSGAADSASVIYSGAARTQVPLLNIARLDSTQATAGTWATAIADVVLADMKQTVSVAFTGSSSLVVPYGVKSMRARGVGGGGGGGGSGASDGSTTGEAGLGGQGAPITLETFTVIPADSLTVTIGTGGTAGTAGGAGTGLVGGTGVSTTVVGTGVAITCFGGVGGKGGVALSGTGVGSVGGVGGSSLAAGAVGGTAAVAGAGVAGSAGTANKGNGGGGGGGLSGAGGTGAAGGAGGSGHVILIWEI